jgi:hypothetical protein
MRELLANYLATLTGVENWTSINFGILPQEDPKGYLFLSSIQPQNKTRLIEFWGCAIAVSATTLNDLADKCHALAKLIANALKASVVCIPNVGSLTLSGNVDVEPPQSYPNQGNQSSTSGFFTAITFVLEIN